MFCKSCGTEIDDNKKFCTNCGAKTENSEVIISNNSKARKPNKILIIFVMAAFVALIGGGVYYYFTKIVSKDKALEEVSMKITGVKTSDYPDINVDFAINNFSGELKTEDILIQEDGEYKKVQSLKKADGENGYLLTYKSEEDRSGKEKKVSLFYTIGDSEIKEDTVYTSPVENSDKQASASEDKSNVVDTRDDSEEFIKSLFSNFYEASIQSINYNDISYVKEYVDVNGKLYKDFTNMLENYAKQGISESLMDYNVEKISKTDASNYEVVAYEKYYIEYGVEGKAKYMEFRSSYTVKKEGNQYKVISINKIDTLSNKDAY